MRKILEPEKQYDENNLIKVEGIIKDVQKLIDILEDTDPHRRLLMQVEWYLCSVKRDMIAYAQQLKQDYKAYIKSLEINKDIDFVTRMQIFNLKRSGAL